uniref:Uncharacterized protein n=1 Tax=Timema tahoe TaxID=61484 RepID=A0A7R9FMW2_9NEOP|nr:unnamed protein product [Timema tahoe]
MVRVTYAVVTHKWRGAGGVSQLYRDVMQNLVHQCFVTPQVETKKMGCGDDLFMMQTRRGGFVSRCKDCYKVGSLNSTSNRDSKLDLLAIGSLVYCESSALDHAATEAGRIRATPIKYPQSVGEDSANFCGEADKGDRETAVIRLQTCQQSLITPVRHPSFSEIRWRKLYFARASTISILHVRDGLHRDFLAAPKTFSHASSEICLKSQNANGDPSEFRMSLTSTTCDPPTPLLARLTTACQSHVVLLDAYRRGVTSPRTIIENKRITQTIQEHSLPVAYFGIAPMTKNLGSLSGDAAGNVLSSDSANVGVFNQSEQWLEFLTTDPEVPDQNITSNYGTSIIMRTRLGGVVGKRASRVEPDHQGRGNRGSNLGRGWENDAKMDGALSPSSHRPYQPMVDSIDHKNTGTALIKLTENNAPRAGLFWSHGTYVGEGGDLDISDVKGLCVYKLTSSTSNGPIRLTWGGEPALTTNTNCIIIFPEPLASESWNSSGRFLLGSCIREEGVSKKFNTKAGWQGKQIHPVFLRKSSTETDQGKGSTLLELAHTLIATFIGLALKVVITFKNSNSLWSVGLSVVCNSTFWISEKSHGKRPHASSMLAVELLRIQPTLGTESYNPFELYANGLGMEIIEEEK